MTRALSVERSHFSLLVAALWVVPFVSMACTKHTLITTPRTDASSAVDGASKTDGGSSTDSGSETVGMTGTGGASGADGATQIDGGLGPDASFDLPAGPDAVVPCTSDQKRCNGLCVAANDPKYGCDPATCDTSSCPTISGATLVCQGSLCVVGTCGTGTKKCGDRCIDVNDPVYGCGASTCDATTCPNPGVGGSVICQAGACVIATCGAGTKKCANRCVAVTDPTYGCGASTCDASTCPSAGTGTLICQAGACVVGTCGTGTKKCGSNCVPTDANNGCGDTTRCTPCAAAEACAGTTVTQCQCVPEAITVTCTGKACGPATGNCGQAVHCPNTCTGVNTCGAGNAGPNGCGCTPNNTAACAGKACGPATNNCGQAVTCASTCSGFNTCGGGTAGPNGCGCTPVLMATACAGKCGSVPNGCGGTYTCSTCAAGQKCDPATSMCVANCTGVTCGTNLKCDPATGMCVDICTGGGTGTVSHCCKTSDCPANLPVCLGSCVARPLGQGCTTSTECASAHCTNGVCCNVAACGTCQSCGLNGVGTCSNVPMGTADAACTASTANCMFGGCNASGGCLASPVNTKCGTICTNGPESAGQWSSATLANRVCNGSAGPSGCVTSGATPSSCPNQLSCADGTSCKTTCFSHADCLPEFYCNAGSCTAQSADGTACSSNIECSNGEYCGGGLGTTTNRCELCVSSYTCPLGAPNCVIGNFRCDPCSAFDTTCNADGTQDCTQISCPANAATCDPISHHCGCAGAPGGGQCQKGQVCLSGQCKMAPGWPCVSPTDCADGICTNGVCPLGRSGAICTGLGTDECQNGNCQFLAVPGTSTCP